MKIAVAILAVLAVSSAYEIPNVGKGELAKELQDFLNLMPIDDMVMVLLEYAGEDQEFQDAIGYLQSKEFQELCIAVEKMPDVITLMNYIHDAGVDIYYLVNAMNNFVGIPEIKYPGTYRVYKAGTGIRGFIDEITALLPLEKMQALYREKMASSKVWIDFVNKLQSPEFQEIVNQVYNHPNFQDLLGKADAAGVDLVAVKDLLYAILGIKIPTKP